MKTLTTNDDRFGEITLTHDDSFAGKALMRWKTPGGRSDGATFPAAALRALWAAGREDGIESCEPARMPLPLAEARRITLPPFAGLPLFNDPSDA